MNPITESLLILLAMYGVAKSMIYIYRTSK
jgi:hypothetical protein